MSITKIKTIAVILAATVAVSAQFYGNTDNARTAALSGAPLSDITDLFAYPVLMTGYTDHAQATWGGNIIGIKSIGDMFSLGLTANQGSVAPGMLAAGATIGATAINTNVPHLLLGFDLGTVQLGADVFFEYARSWSESETGGNENNAYNTYLNPGARLAANIDLGSLAFLAKFGIGFPGFSRTAESGTTTTTDPEMSGLYMEMGAEVGIPLGSIDLAIGGEYFFENRESQVTGTWPTNGNSVIGVYVTAGFNVLETAEAAIGYSFTREAAYTITPVGNEETHNSPSAGTHYHAFSLGLENVWTEAWFFDSFALRAGTAYEIAIGNRTKTTNTANDDFTATKGMAGHTVAPTLGFGVSKSFLTLDLALAMDSWNTSGALVGPPVAMVTGTIKF